MCLACSVPCEAGVGDAARNGQNPAAVGGDGASGACHPAPSLPPPTSHNSITNTPKHLKTTQKPLVLQQDSNTTTTNPRCIDRQPIAATQSPLPTKKHCPVPDELCHYVIVRADLPHGSQVAQAIHAAGESAALGPRLPTPGTVAVALRAQDEAHLGRLALSLGAVGIVHHAVRECDGELMALGLAPTADREPIRRLLSSLPLVR